jgi:hypothetical protein
MDTGNTLETHGGSDEESVAPDEGSGEDYVAPDIETRGSLNDLTQAFQGGNNQGGNNQGGIPYFGFS